MINNHSYFHNHGLRKFNATTIEDIDFANIIQGRKPNKIVESYFKINPKRVKEKYIKHLKKLTIFSDEELEKFLKDNLKDDEKTVLNKELISEIKKTNKKLDKIITILEKHT